MPLKQYIAVTGSVNQKGEVQAIGGVNEKIEGFFDCCRHLGSNGKQGVMIPESNVKDLMLRKDVVEAVAEGQFHIYAVKTIDEGIEILTGKKAGERKANGTYPKGTINHLVDEKLRELAEGLKNFGEKEKPAKKRSSYNLKESLPANGLIQLQLALKFSLVKGQFPNRPNLNPNQVPSKKGPIIQAFCTTLASLKKTCSRLGCLAWPSWQLNSCYT